MNKFFLFLIASSILIFGCKQQPAEDALKVGVVNNQQLEIVSYIKTIAEKENLPIEIIEFEDYTEINSALKQKTIDVNCFQNQFYLNQVNKERNLDFVAIGKTYLAPLGLYSTKHSAIEKISENDSISIPDDVFTMSRSLLLLEKANLIRLRPNEHNIYEPKDILENLLNLQIKPVDSSQIREELSVSDFVILTFNYKEYLNKKLATELFPLLQEDTSSNFVQLIVTRKELEKDFKLQHFVKLYNSEQVKNFILEKYQHKLIPAW